MGNSIKLLEDVVAFVFDALTSYAQTPTGAAQLAQIVVDIESEFGAQAAQYASGPSGNTGNPGDVGAPSGNLPRKAAG